MANKATVSRGESCGIKAAHGIKSLIHKIKAFDKRCVEKVRSKNQPRWLGHIPLLSAILAVTALLAYFSLYLLFTLGALILFWGMTNGYNLEFSDESSSSDEQDEYDGFQNGPEGLGCYMGGFKVDDDEEDD